MISSQVAGKLAQVYSHPNAAQAKRSQADYASHEAHREIDVFHSVKSQDADGDGKISLQGPGHCLMVPWSRTAEYSGCPQTGSLHRVDGLFVNSSERPTFETFIETQFHPDGITKREASFGGAEIVARTVSVNHTDPSLNYVEEFRIAR
ncbi:MAG: hypothetical protein KF760_31890 [Candidatus Eremiobacteraeota bacterium]|nr:hypothetical protein [Candidatus Eremiobacteraeota bacterium]MCW5869439.1 hypothetical protein [Candidatus Eremiobacteraeota bacterium]